MWASVLLSLLWTNPVQGFTFYPPSNQSNLNLQWAINGTGPPGIYTSSETPDSEYGYYNWCQMPHVRKQEYPVPSSEYTLGYVEVIQRHNKRTPYASNTFFKEDITWNCDGQGPYAYAKDKSQFETTPIYWQAEVNTQNPFEYTVGPGFVGSTCQFPGITSEGLEDSKQHGVDFGGVYRDLLGFLPEGGERDKYQWRVTNNVITSQTLSGFAAGLYPDVKEYYALIQSDAYDSLEPAFSCPMATAIQSYNEGANPAWTAHLTDSADVRARFYNVSGIQYDDTAGWNTSWDHPYDNLSAKQCHQKPLPCSVNNTALCTSQEDANEIYRLGNWEYAYRWRGSENATMLSVLTMAPWFKELQGHMEGYVNGTNCVRYYHNFAHDGSVAPVLGVLQIDHPVWPGMASEVVFEIWKKGTVNFVRVLWGGQPLQTSTPLGTLDMVPYQSFMSYLDDMLPSDPVAACQVAS